MLEKTYHIPAISCGHCIHTIKSELSEMEGIQEVEGDLEKKTIKVVFDSPASEEKIMTLLNEINYPASN